MSHKPSQQQLNSLQALPRGRALLVQYQWLWPMQFSDKRVEPTMISDCLDALAKLGAQLVTRAKVDLLTVGDTSARWSELWLVEFPDADALLKQVSSRSFTALLDAAEAVEAIVASPPPPKVQKVIRVLNRFMPWLPKPKCGNDMPVEELQGGINPTEAQMQAFQAADQTRPVHMFNLLRFHERAQYQNGDRGRSGQQAYEGGYGKVAVSCFLRLGGKIIAAGRYRMTLLGAEGDPALEAWDEIAVVQYPNRPAFLHMLSNSKYVKALEHRNAGLAETQLWSTAPQAEYL